MLTRRALGVAACGAGLAGGWIARSQAATEKTLRIAMTISGIPRATGAPDFAGEGQLFMGITLYDTLIAWDLSQADKPCRLVPGLATTWTTDPAEPTRWTITIRPGVRFHDGSTFDAAAAAWNFARILDQGAPHYDPVGAAQLRSRIPNVVSAKAVSADVLELRTRVPDAFVPYQLVQVFMASPAGWAAAGSNWDRFNDRPSGTGPWKLDRVVPGQRAELVPNRDYWEKAEVPRMDRLVLLPMPDPLTRVAALLTGQVDWIEAPPPDAVPRLQAQGFKLGTNAWPHNWTWEFNRLPGSPWNDVRVRKAANLAINRDDIKTLLGGLMIPAQGFVPPGSAWFGNPAFKVGYNPAQARSLMAEAGYGPAKPLELKALIALSGSGQMQPQAMNEVIQQNLAEIGIKVDFTVVDWAAMITAWRAGADKQQSLGAHSVNFSFGIYDPFNAFIRHLGTNQVAPVGVNWGHFSDPGIDGMFEKLQSTFDPAAQDALATRIHERIVDEALFLFVAHDVNPRVISPKLRDYVQPQQTMVDFGRIDMAG